MLRAADVALFDELGQILLLAEIRTPPSPTTFEWAMRIRQDICSRLKGFVPRYFLVVARDNSYLWTSAAPVTEPSDLCIPTQELLTYYFDLVKTTAAVIQGSALELMVGMWLGDLTHGIRQAKHVLPPALADLATAAENGRIEFADEAA
jgi:hypothetical protein